MASRKPRKRSVPDELGVVIKSVRGLKDRVTGKRWRRLHRIESELSTVAGLKTAMPSTAKRKKAKKKAKKS